MYENARPKGLDITESGVYQINTICKSHKIKVDYCNNYISYMGIIIFPEDIDGGAPKSVYSFIQRYLLNLLILDKKDDVINELKHDNIKLLVNGTEFKEMNLSIDKIISMIKKDSPFNIKSDLHRYNFSWILDQGKSSIEFVFPKQYDLISGKDKKEMGETFKNELEIFEYNTKLKDIDIRDYQKTDHTRIMANYGGFYMINQMRNIVYIDQYNGNIKYLYNIKYPVESLNNLFNISHYMDYDFYLDINMRYYGSKKNFTYPLSKLTSFMETEQCIAYVGIEDFNDEKIKGTVLYVNEDLKYNHMLFFEFPIKAFSDNLIPIKVDMNTFIPTNNVENLFNDNQFIEKNQIKININH